MAKRGEIAEAVRFCEACNRDFGAPLRDAAAFLEKVRPVAATLRRMYTERCNRPLTDAEKKRIKATEARGFALFREINQPSPTGERYLFRLDFMDDGGPPVRIIFPSGESNGLGGDWSIG